MIWVILALAILVVLYYISTHNRFVALQNKIDEAFSTMDVYLVKRSDLIPNIVATVKGYAKHEADTLTQLVEARNHAVTNSEKIKADSDLTNAITKLFAVVEAYPDLKANESFLQLQQSLHQIEGDIANSRKYYNGVVRQYNTMIDTIPSKFIANANGFLKEALFEVSDESQRENVKVEF